MPNKKLRYGQYYHIYNRGNNRENLFVEQRNYPYFLKQYTNHILPIAETCAYCLLPNHFHFAIRTRTEDEQEAYWRQEILPYSEGNQVWHLKIYSSPTHAPSTAPQAAPEHCLSVPFIATRWTVKPIYSP